MEIVLGLLRSLVFGAIVISTVEIIVPEGNFKKYYNYVASLIMVLIVFSAVSVVDLDIFHKRLEAKIAGNDNFESLDEELSHKQNVFFENEIKNALEKDMIEYFEQTHGVRVNRVSFDKRVSNEFNKVEVGDVVIILDGCKKENEFLKIKLEKKYDIEVKF